MDITKDSRFEGIERFEKKVWLASPTMHGDEQKWVDEAIQTNWVSTVGENINVVEKQIAEYVGCEYSVALSSGTAALHLAMKLVGEKLYGQPMAGHGTLEGKRVFVSDITFDATVNPICYEGGIPVFIDTERDTWNMDPLALEKGFELYPDVKMVVLVHLYGTPGKIDEIKKICNAHGALIVEDAAESFGASYKGKQTGGFGKVGILSGNGNKIITGSSGGFLLTNSLEDANKIRKWSTQSREDAPWYQHEELGYNYRMSNIIAGILRGQLPYLEEHIEQKRKIYERYKTGLADLPVKMNPYDVDSSTPNFWLSCLLIDEDAMCQTVRGEKDEMWITEPGKSCPGEILAAIKAFNAEGRPVWKPMHMQPIYRTNPFVTVEGNGRGRTNAYISGSGVDVGADIFRRGLCLPSDNKMTPEQQDRIIEIIHRCFL
ncbi:dTDP-4-amino-4,6-dideoxygalactose transaminase [Lachnospiraceae bacterium NE2001]|nr:dTDP-4-amino-4,6-dideoxygalactose transaminase [Lachnospiraceae bacterium NE2001]